MKRYSLLVLLCASTLGYAQKPAIADNLNANKDAVLAKYIPTYNGEMLYSNYQVDPVKFEGMIDQVRADVYRNIKPGNTAEQALKRHDVDFYLRNVMKNYKLMYGMDSIGFKKFETLLIEKKGDPQLTTLMMAAIKQVYLKRPTADQNKYMDSLIYHAEPNDAALFKRSAAYRQWVDAYLEQKYATKYAGDVTFKNIKGVMPISVILNEIQNPFIRELECFNQSGKNLKVVRDTALAESIYKEFNTVVTNPYYKSQMQEIYDNYKRMHTANVLSPDFTYGAVDGKKVTLSNLRGKYVYIDIWATWCAPCKAEIPSLTKVEEDYKDKNIQFVSLSVDRQADAGKWHSYVTGNKLSGIQVMADKDFQSDFIRKFNIASIPRFILIDPAGKVIASDALRPSDTALRKQLDGLLK